MNNQKSNSEEILSTKATTELLSLSVRTIYRMTKKGMLTRYKLSGKFYYKMSDILAALKPAPVKSK